jgi:hypothetical protein
VTDATSHETERRASGPGARRVLGFGLGGFVLAGLILGGYALVRPSSPMAPHAAAAGVAAAPTGSGNATYGTVPSWLPRVTAPVGRVVQASATHPWIGIEGDTVVVHLAGHAVDATLVGPQVPRQGQFPLPKTTPCTFYLTLTHATGAMPITAAQLEIFDERGHRYTPRVRSPTGAAAPSHVGPGQSVTVRLDTILPTGAGEVVWTTNGTAPLVSYEFVTEID